MSRIGKLPVEIPSGVNAEIDGRTVRVKGPKGEIEMMLPKLISAQIKENKIELERSNDQKFTKSLHGTYRSHLANAVLGVTEGWKKELEIIGTGYRAEVSGKDLILTVGFSHPVKITAPDGIDFRVEKTIIIIEGYDKHLVGQVAANVRKVRPPEPYKGKGIRYTDEIVRRKAGKAAKTAGAA